jgi:oxygen-independent coproporphyrinogen-3 oxidase
MAGIYLHIPFCRQACHYCNFHFSTSLNRKNDFVVALLKEMELQRHYIRAVETVYFGGGTPSLLTEEELGQILGRLRELFTIEPDAEVTLEANPDDITMAGKLKAWKKAGINRLSIGVQSFFEEDLQWMNRAHDAGQATNSIRMAQKEGFDNISVDLIYGGPTLPDGHWEKNVAQAVASGIPHLSCYALTVEPRTALDKMIHQKKKEAVSPDDQARQFLLLMGWLAAAGYEHYEISNFALPGRRSRHNSSYWQGKPYLGLGPSAHSYNGRSRQWNVANNAQYTDALLSGKLLFEKEELTPVEQLNEYIMISLRTMEGCDLRQVSDRFGAEKALELRKQAERYVREGKIKLSDSPMPDGDRKDSSMKEALIKNTRLILTQEGKLLADGIAADLFFGPTED